MCQEIDIFYFFLKGNDYFVKNIQRDGAIQAS